MATIIRHHHERFDGKGYPDRLKGDAIPLEAAIIAVVDAFDAMTTYRPYKAALSLEQAYDEIRRNRATQFYPGICDLFLKLLERNPDGFQHRPCLSSETLRPAADGYDYCGTAFCPPPPAPVHECCHSQIRLSSQPGNSKACGRESSGLRGLNGKSMLLE